MVYFIAEKPGISVKDDHSELFIGHNNAPRQVPKQWTWISANDRNFKEATVTAGGDVKECGADDISVPSPSPREKMHPLHHTLDMELG